MRYIPHWERLGDALKRVMATGASEEEAKIDLCRALADRKIDVRVRIAATNYGRRGQVFSDGNVRVPPHLRPGDLDWTQSRPFAQWTIGPRVGEHYFWIGGWENRPLDFIELSTADVIKILCSGEEEEKSSATARAETDAIKALVPLLKSNPQLKRADAAELCREAGYHFSDRGFQYRVWPAARVQAGLPAKALSGRKRETSR